ncbi:UDP-N-acetylmuramoyl-L-alanyl-D-glutamate--2,6-diaminopimelate ligase [Virgibacillus phasianinus]|uniref:UDP-N-acetylmuramoyl-L-alanyl-D-glutamate--2,6-diaminopimelate ligase n=1 Tax=Virgibacillus phasianinus TaxID=2017483 RepID=A0A220U6A7_9BACI|nr:UDP-N-acetylmuramoyl-L-alanyl-D-glutamate--2,6-diaminopimelate ligase [Virgibacillus phasianinus]ASK63585.1 UDP-N-acetylmuramoyl-L-alanyl-D-glutamate--2,6-diaminopimelate ligase [Virgibacillus phasianinus]
MKLNEIISILPFYKAMYAVEDVFVNEIKMDSREVNQGDLFICINGFTVDGHEYIDQAIANGAAAILVEKAVDTNIPTILVPDSSRALAMIAAHFYHYPTTKFPLIGITGTNGKTTITYLVEKILNECNWKTGIIGTIQMKIGNRLFPVQNTTPDSLFLQKSFHKMVEYNVDTAIMEVSSHALDMGRTYGCDFDVAVFSNLSQDHLDYHKDMNDYLRAKSLLFSQLGNTYRKTHPKFAVINVDDPSHDMIKRSTAQHIITYGCNTEAAIMATDVELKANRTIFTLNTQVGEISVSSMLIGMFNVYNMLAAVGVAMAFHIPLGTIKSALEKITGISGRFEPVGGDQPFTTIVDYAHTPDSLENVLQVIKEFAKKNIYVVVGCGGDRDKTKRPQMAAIALKYANKVIFTSDNPRTEDPSAILEDMVNGQMEKHYEIIQDRRQAIYRVINLASDDDVVLIAGKGHETYQLIGHTKYQFDDREIARQAILSKGK